MASASTGKTKRAASKKSRCLPDVVGDLGKTLKNWPDHELHDLAGKLISESDIDLVAMWRCLQKNTKKRYGGVEPDDLFAWGFLHACAAAMTLPSYYYLKGADRNKLIAKIERLSDDLSEVLTDNNLDFTLVHSAGKNFNGFYVYEDFSESNRARIDQCGDKKLPIARLLKLTAERAVAQVRGAQIKGNARGEQSALHARRFSRSLSEYILRLYRQPLGQVIATAANKLYGTRFEASDIANHRNR